MSTSRYNQQHKRSAAKRIAAGQSYRQIAADPHMPCLRTLARWAQDPNFKQMVETETAAYTDRFDKLLDEYHMEALRVGLDNLRGDNPYLPGVHQTIRDRARRRDMLADRAEGHTVDVDVLQSLLGRTRTDSDSEDD